MSDEDDALQQDWDRFMKGEPAEGSPSEKGNEGDDVKVPIEVEDDHKDTAAKEGPEDQAGTEAEKAAGTTPEDDEAARVEAAKRAGEQAAADDIKADADKVRAERDELQKKLDSVTDEIDAAKKEAADSADRLQRLQADWDNYRRRTAQERNDERERAAEKLVVNLLPVLDDMERACDHAGQAAADDENLKTFVDGVEAVHDKMLSILGKEGVEVIDPKGEPFDPLVHQAVGREEDKDAYEETVAQVYQKGYSMGGKVIRTAMVTVTYGGPKRPAEDKDAKDGDAKQGGKPSEAGSEKAAHDPGESGNAD